MQSILLRPTTQTLNFRTTPRAMRLFFFTLFTISFFLNHAQQRCGTQAPDPEVFERWLNEKTLEKQNQLTRRGKTATIYQIPVVVHVVSPSSGVHLGISDERIKRQIEILNEDFGRTNADADNTPTVFLPVAADTEIQFVLAKQDPVGNPTSGIVRVRGSKEKYSALSSHQLLRSESYWPPAHYLNIHVADFNTFLGFASFPIVDLEGVNNKEEDYFWDGVFIDYQYFGENPSSPAFTSFGRTTTHEVGHYLGLRHIWGDGGCNIDDFVDDTPTADASNSGLSTPCSFPSNDSNVCETAEMFQNYMDYTDDTCMNLFTEGQKSRMRTILENAPRRTSLLTSPGLQEPARFSNDLAITEILSPNFNVCDNRIVPSLLVTNFGDQAVTNYDVTLFVEEVATQTINHLTNLESNNSETVSFSAVTPISSPSTIGFEISNVNGGLDEDASNNTKTLVVSTSSSPVLPFLDNFEGSTNINGLIGPSHPWEVVSVPEGASTNQVLKFKSFENSTYFGESTVLKTPVFDLTGINAAELKFRYAYAYTPNSFQDGLVVRLSTDCGESFSDEFLFSAFGQELATTSSTEGPFTPQSVLYWQDTTINITPFTDIDGVQIAFQGVNGGGNNIYIDDISLIQANLNEFDLNVLEVKAPLLTCRETTEAKVRMRNVGFEEITSFTYEYTFGGVTFTQNVSNIFLLSGDFVSLDLNVNLDEGANSLMINVLSINGNPDQEMSNNSIEYTITKNLASDKYPLSVDFERPHNWTAISNSTQLWSEASIGNNQTLAASGFSSSQIGSESWFISPALSVGSLDSAGLSFRASYGKRGGFNDRLRVLMSIDCGNTYTFELVNADADSLAIIESSGSWVPTSDDEWKEFNIDLKASIAWQDEIKLAFVFTNDGGNNLYVDDINVGIKPSLEENNYVVFPNPAVGSFNIAFSLAERDDIQIQIIDLSGRVVFEEEYKNVLNQVYDFEALSQEGFYFVKVAGKQINKTERLYIRQ